jgi:RIO kinase 3
MSAAPELIVQPEADKPAKCAWGVTLGAASTEPVASLSDVMSEQLATEMLLKEKKKAEDKWEVLKEEDKAEEAAGGAAAVQVSETECTDDLLIAQMLQMQFDRDYDEALKGEERKQNGSAKVTMDYSKYKVIPDNPIWDDEDSEEDKYFTMDDSKRAWDTYEEADPNRRIPKCGFRRAPDGSIVTKHDKETSQRENGKRVMEFPAGIETGDGGGFDFQLSNAVYNKIRNFSVRDAKRKARVHDKSDKSTVAQAVDPATRLLLHKMIDSGILEQINGPIASGKEAVILHADGGNAEGLDVPAECAVKIFKTTLNEFKTRERYIRDDYRFKDRFSKQNPRKVIHMWAEKELHNLKKMEKFGVCVPQVVALKKHVLVMSFVGSGGVAAPKLKDARLSSAELELAYDETVRTMETLYNDCHLVHADLSEYNILWHEGACHFIDVSQSVEPNHPEGLTFLMRDCSNITGFFRKRGVHDVMKPHQLFSKITGLKIDGEADVLSQVVDYQKKEDVIDAPFEVIEAAAAGGSSDSSSDEDDLGNAVSAARAIPGHAKPRRGSGGKGKSPKGIYVTTGKSPKSPKGVNASTGKSPKSPGGSALHSLTNEDLQKLKDSLVDDGEAVLKPSVVRFQEE